MSKEYLHILDSFSFVWLALSSNKDILLLLTTDEDSCRNRLGDNEMIIKKIRVDSTEYWDSTNL